MGAVAGGEVAGDEDEVVVAAVGGEGGGFLFGGIEVVFPADFGLEGGKVIAVGQYEEDGFVALVEIDRIEQFINGGKRFSAGKIIGHCE